MWFIIRNYLEFKIVLLNLFHVKYGFIHDFHALAPFKNYLSAEKWDAVKKSRSTDLGNNNVHLHIVFFKFHELSYYCWTNI